jgi:cytochrome c oxidase subunit 4
MSQSDLRREDPVTDTPEPGHGAGGHPTPKEYVRIGLILGVITAFEVGTYYLQDTLGGWLIPILFIAAIVKFSIVVLWFMHLKFDSKTYARFFVMGVALAVTLYIVVLMSLRVFLR